MSPGLDDLFHRAVSLAPEGRSAFLDSLHLDKETRRQLESLLSHDAGATEPPLPQHIVTAANRLISELEPGGMRCGPYRLLEVIGRGGMGVVYLAERVDGEVNQKVAIKLLPMGAGEIQRERFLRERQILASLAHPNIAHMLDAGHLESGQPYLTMEYVNGKPIDQFADGFAPRQKIELFLKVCAAVEYMHRNLIIHRDLKPGNILVASDAEPKLLDFGIAKLLDVATDSTHTSLRMMTPDYASPEQVSGQGFSTATDVYSLGAVLYKLLTGMPAHQFDSNAPEAVALVIREKEPKQLSHWAPDLRGDLDIILSKALRKNPFERYGTVVQFANDLSRYLRNEPVTARPDSLLYRARKFAVRHRGGLATGLVAVLALLSGAGIAIRQATVTSRQRDRALTELRRAEATNDFSSYLLSHATPSVDKPISHSELLARGEALIDKRYSDPDLRVHLLINLADRYFENQQFTDRARVLKKAFEESRQLVDLTLRSEAVCQWASQLAETGDHKQAFQLLSEVFPPLASPDHAAVEARCRVIESIVSKNSDPWRAVRAAGRAVLLERRRGGSAIREREALMALATAYSRVLRYQEADRIFERGLMLLDAGGPDSSRETSVLLNNWSALLQDGGQVLRAAFISERAVRIARALDAKNGASLSMLATYGSALLSLGRYPEADQVITEALQKARISGSTARLVPTLYLAMESACETRNFKRGEMILAEANSALKGPSSKYLLGIVETMTARLALEKQDGETALAWSTRARATLETATPTQMSLSRALYQQARALNQLGRFQEALQVAGAATSHARVRSGGFKYTYQLGRNLLELATAHAGLGNTAQAITTLDAATENLIASAGTASRATVRAESLRRKLAQQ
ncbi:MAG: Serine/threonine-protein kinase PknD [Bryobacteraceae bacterium]|nr:Serine/threonine-protein kinase PknD [Bryobacteraceae bacterium]